LHISDLSPASAGHGKDAGSGRQRKSTLQRKRKAPREIQWDETFRKETLYWIPIVNTLTGDAETIKPE
jgi:hypothetical protein